MGQIGSIGGKSSMNLNEECLLRYLQNPCELESLTKVLEDNIRFVSEESTFASALV